MCFSVNVNIVKEELEERYGVQFPDKYRYEPSYYYHAFSFPELPALCSGRSEEFRLFRWGLIPSWVKTEAEADLIRTKTLNARSESIGTKRSYSASFKSKRCIIPVRGFYEWQHNGKKKIPWYIYSRDNDVFSLAGLYSEWLPGPGRESVSTFTIITTEANELMADIHNSKKRMPLILNKSAEHDWIDLSVTESDLISLLHPYPADRMNAHVIGNLINNRKANRNSIEVIQPLAVSRENLLF